MNMNPSPEFKVTNRLSKFQTKALKGTGVLVTWKPVAQRSWTQALRCAMQGLCDAWMGEPNFRVHVYAGTSITALGFFVRLSLTEWLWISFAIGLVIFAELMNTAIEGTVDLVVGMRPDPLARRVKDIAAGCVLVAAILSTVIGALTFFPHLIVRGV